MNFMFENGKSIESAFIEYHANNPVIYDYFKKFAFEMLEKCGKISAKMIVNRIRWEVGVETTTRDFKINDAFSAHYARKLKSDFPAIKEKIETRGLRS